MIAPFEQKGFIPGGHLLEEFVRAAGFTDIEVKNYKIPVGKWGKGDDIHECYLIPDHVSKVAGKHAIGVWLGIVESLEPLFRKITTDWTEEKRLDLLNKVRENILDPNFHLYSDMYDYVLDTRLIVGTVL